jgi:hypothetical protein
MNLIDIEHKTINHNNKQFELIQLDKIIDLTEQNDRIETSMTHILKGFEEDIYLIQQKEPDGASFFFACYSGVNGLYVNLMNEDVENQAYEIVLDMLDDFWTEE